MGKKRSRYHQQLEQLQVDLIKLQRWLHQNGKRLVVILEGRDAAGKGGVIKRITEKMDTRSYHIAALPKPNDRESKQWYFQRYVSHLPAAGELVLFDRSWYNRAVVEPANHFCSDDDYERFMEAVPAFEKLLTDDGIILIKYWLAVDQKEEEKRFAARASDPLKRWKLSPVDLASRSKFKEIGTLRNTMIERTHTPHAPWFVVDFNHKKRGRINLIRHLLNELPDALGNVDIPEITLPPLGHRPATEKMTEMAIWVPDTYEA
ncbi:polyphosphate kinase 2 [Frateuria aurantia]